MQTAVKVMTFDEAGFERDVVQSDAPVLVDFWAPWCPPCRAIAPVIEQVAGELEGRVIVGKVNIDENPALAEQFGVSSIPTLLFFKDGNVVDRIVGVTSRKALVEKLKAL